MVSDAELVQRLREFLRSSDLSTTTTGTVRRQLESDFNVDLSDKKAFIREQVDRFLSELENERKEQGGEEQEEEEEEGEEEEGVKEEEEEEQEEEEESSEEDGGSSRKRGSNKNSKEVKRGGGGFTKLCTLSPQLHEFIGEPELARTEVVKRLWAYIRENSLQDPSNKRKILCDERLHGLFNVKSIDMFQMNKALSKHIWPLNSEEAPPVKTTQKEKPHKKDKATDGSPRKRKRQPGGNYGFLAPLQLSDALVKFIGTGENELPRSDVIKRIWNHIKENNLQDPANKRNIICDEKLKELFQVDSFTGFTVSKLLGGHLTKAKQ